MKTKSLIALAFLAGISAGAATNAVIAQAKAGDSAWAEAANDPAFRKAVVEVINSCIVQNSIIYCE